MLWRAIDQKEWSRAPMTFVANDRWSTTFSPNRNMRHAYTIEAWRDPFASLLDGIIKKRAAGVPLDVEGGEAVALIAEADPRGLDKRTHKMLLSRLEKEDNGSDAQLDLVSAPDTQVLMGRCGPRHQVSRYDRVLELIVDRKAAIYSSWYELFPRSITESVDRHGTFRNVIGHLPYVRDLGFDVLYFPPLSPIGKKNRKGKNNTLTPSETDVGSVYGHRARRTVVTTRSIPSSARSRTFRALVAAAKDHGLEIAIDFAIQCSPDHPWIKEHPEWFQWRPDGDDPVCREPAEEVRGHRQRAVLRRVAAFAVARSCATTCCSGCARGVRIIRVDNPHTKPIPFWKWVIAEINRQYPDVIFLAEAFTRPAMMRELAKVGYQQSYTYFTWRNEKWEIEQYMAELAGPMGEYYRPPNFFVNTPDINPVLPADGRGAPRISCARRWPRRCRAIGEYIPASSCAKRARCRARRKYLDSEKYEIRVWDYDRPGNIKDYIRALNHIRRENPALHDFRNAVRLNATNDNVIAYAKFTPRQDQLHPRDGQPRPVQPAGMCLRDPALGMGGCPTKARSKSRTSSAAIASRFTARPIRSRSILTSAPPSCGASRRRRTGKAADDRSQRHAVVSRRDHLSAAREELFRCRTTTGMGDFVGVTQKLDYVKELGATAIWVMPFYPSPLRDDGYDISDYRGINPSYGTAKDFKHFVKSAHERGIRVITELVINHTSDQHPWFQRARAAKAGSAARNFYVWSDTEERYQDTRIIFLDTEKSNWTWDEEAQAFYWHRFLFPPARSQLRQSEGDRGGARHDALLARPRRRRVASRRDPLSCRARRHQLREPRGDARGPEDHSRRGRQGLPRPHAARRGQPMARGDRAIFRRRRRMPHGVPLPADAAYLHGLWRRRTVTRSPTSCARPRRFPRAASGRSSCATMTR